jgi:hypothetical protein
MVISFRLSSPSIGEPPGAGGAIRAGRSSVHDLRAMMRRSWEG